MKTYNSSEDLDEAEKELEEIIDFKRLEKWIKKNIGKRCKKFGTGCYICNAWHGFDILKGLRQRFIFDTIRELK